ncbi:hypothetical protein [Entomomonas asaccharolytica]|uniref:Uncharacterized protein n=1 Tax=Entomomonas asaccharolytica TaxID=2785331 RepID=A0A974NFD2_9GAMM|nr:hypothetical protein [Entomomonas asaccharolytica]QQP85751.1 hypothetical protein JHT90_00350 [Entomomonas asaccharolytica]
MKFIKIEDPIYLVNPETIAFIRWQDPFFFIKLVDGSDLPGIYFEGSIEEFTANLFENIIEFN